MPAINDPCTNCAEGIFETCEPNACLRCPSCGQHETDEDPWIDERPEGPITRGFTPAANYANYNSQDLLSNVMFSANVGPTEPVDPEAMTWHSSVVLPEVVQWHMFPDYSGFAQVRFRDAGPDYPERVDALRQWATDNGFTLAIAYTTPVNIGGGYQPQAEIFWLGRGVDTPVLVPNLPWPEDFVCPYCSQTHTAYTTRCPETNTRLRCNMCRFFRGDLRDVYGQYLCSDCSHYCEYEGCEELVTGGEGYCEDHAQYAYCTSCDTRLVISMDEDFLLDENEQILCEDCFHRVCPSCNRLQRRGLTYYDEGLGMNICRRCSLGGEDAESLDEDDEHDLGVPAIPGRENIRLCGVEIEGGDGSGNGQSLATEFHNQGLSNWDRMGGYHSDDGTNFAHVERDSSVDWEAVIGPVNLAVPEEVTKLNQAVRSIRQLVRDGVLALDLRAGCHIHVEAARTSLDGAFNLSTLFAYAEDVIFRLAAARWPVHRAVQDTHYTRPIPKELRKVQFARHHAGGDEARYYALSFNNYFRQMLGRCRCGATRYDSWEDCTCELGKCTFEFRVFNTTANPRKLHAYLALTQALVAYAMDMGKVEAGEWSPLAFVPRRFKDMEVPAQDELVSAWRERLVWMFTELPLTTEEKESLAYCVRNSELATVGEDFINTELLTTEQSVIEEVTA